MGWIKNYNDIEKSESLILDKEEINEINWNFICETFGYDPKITDIIQLDSWDGQTWVEDKEDANSWNEVKQ